MRSGHIPHVHYLTDDGTHTGTVNAIGDYSAGAEWYVTAPAGGYKFTRLMVSYEDTGGGIMQEYGNLGSALTNGIEMEIRDDNGTVISDLTGGVPIKSNGDWGRLVGPDIDRKDWGQGNDLFIARWSFFKFEEESVVLQPGWSFVVKLNDSFVGLVSQYFNLQGSE